MQKPSRHCYCCLRSLAHVEFGPALIRRREGSIIPFRLRTRVVISGKKSRQGDRVRQCGVSPRKMHGSIHAAAACSSAVMPRNAATLVCMEYVKGNMVRPKGVRFDEQKNGHMYVHM